MLLEPPPPEQPGSGHSFHSKPSPPTRNQFPNQNMTTAAQSPPPSHNPGHNHNNAASDRLELRKKYKIMKTALQKTTNHFNFMETCTTAIMIPPSLQIKKRCAAFCPTSSVRSQVLKNPE